ncbi:hypothetical protein [Streptomyces catenulae]|uniref:Uncharacterized protein n=1 Tax=Streptomyces catenulae TaxID=66875 RepID=A0ABV2YSA8_9ACTN|nr:hypothetical protein [Streptomyces catenulae]
MSLDLIDAFDLDVREVVADGATVAAAGNTEPTAITCETCSIPVGYARGC